MEKTLNEEIGKIEKPKADKVMGKKKAFICVLLQAPQEASKELHDLIFKYWEAVDKNISTLEEKTGVVKKIFVEGIPGKGEDVAMNLKEASLGAWNVVEERRKTGAEVSELENLENLQKVIDWSKCLNVGLTNRSVAEKISEELRKASEENMVRCPNAEMAKKMIALIEQVKKKGEGIMQLASETSPEERELEFAIELKEFLNENPDKTVDDLIEIKIQAA